MDQPSNQLDISSLSQSPRRQEDNRREGEARSQHPGEAEVLESALASSPRSNSAGASRRVNFPLGLKLVLGAALISLLPLVLLAATNTFFATQRSRAAITETAQKQLISIRDTQKRQVEKFLQDAIDHSTLIARTPSVTAAMSELSATYNQLLLNGNNGGPLSPTDIATRRGALAEFYSTRFQEEFTAQNADQSLDTTGFVEALSDASVALQYAYIVQNPYATEERYKLTVAPDGSAYSATHGKYIDTLRDLAASLNFYDIHFANPDGVLIFTTAKQVDIGNSLITGPLAQSPMADAYRRVTADLTNRTAKIGDLAAFYPAYNEQSMFTAAPIYEGNTLLGVVTLEIPVDQIDAIMTNNADWKNLGLGETGETHLVRLSDGVYLSNKRALIETPDAWLESRVSSGRLTQVQADLVRAKGNVAGLYYEGEDELALVKTGQPGFVEVDDGETLLGFTPVTTSGLNWVLFAEQEAAEVLTPITTLTQTLVRQSVLIALGVLALVALITLLFIRSITRPVAQLASVAERVGQGDLSQLATVQTNDEIGALANTFNNSILQLRDANERQEAELERGKQLQANIGEFLNVAMDIAQGDFTKRGQVSEDALGNVVDAINFMTEELGYVLKDVQNATDSVNQGATEMFGTADTIAQSAQVQVQEAQKAREDVQGIRSTMRQVSDEMNLSAESATQALNASREGQQAVVQTLNGMQDIRREVQAVSKRVKNLGDRSLEISEIVETISRISEQTNLLAVNAAIESSGAGEAGARFAVVADQVRKLAEESAYAAQRVATLIKSVQDEVQEVITGVEAGTREVEEGYRVASRAGQRLEDISTIVERSAELAQRISKATQEQVSRVEQVGQVVEQMAEISQASQDTVSQGREAAEKLRQLATQLSDNLSRFRLA